MWKCVIGQGGQAQQPELGNILTTSRANLETSSLPESKAVRNTPTTVAKTPGDSVPKLTDTYRRLEFAAGSREDFICFDFSMIDSQTFVLHSVIYTSGCGFLSDAAYCIIPAGQAAEAAHQIVREA